MMNTTKVTGNSKTRVATLLSALFAVLFATVQFTAAAPKEKTVLAGEIPKELIQVRDKVVYVESLDVKDQHHHDPSNIIKYKGKYYLWYSQTQKDNGWAGHTRLATSVDGLDWEPQGIAIPSGEPGDIDDKAAITAYVVPHDKKFYLFYTAFGTGQNVKGITYAVADTPDGPWKKSGKKFMWPSGNKEELDGVHIDDANVIFFNGKWFFYYKIRPFGARGDKTTVCLATSDNILGPYTKYENNPVFGGHAFSTWVHRNGVAGFGFGTFWSEDGYSFVKTSKWSPGTVGLYCPENFGDGANANGVAWGIKVMKPKGKFRYIARMELPLLDLSKSRKTDK